MLEHALAGAGESIRPPAIVARQRLDPLSRLEPRDRAVERARAELLTRDHVNVLRHRVAMLRTVGEADENQQRRLGEAAEIEEFVRSCLHVVTRPPDLAPLEGCHILTERPAASAYATANGRKARIIRCQAFV